MDRLGGGPMRNENRGSLPSKIQTLKTERKRNTTEIEDRVVRAGRILSDLQEGRTNKKKGCMKLAKTEFIVPGRGRGQ